MLSTIVTKIMTVMGLGKLRRNGWDGRLAKFGMGHYKPRMGRAAVLGTKVVAYKAAEVLMMALMVQLGKVTQTSCLPCGQSYAHV